MNNPLVQPDPGLYIWTIVTFLVLLALLGKFAWRPLLEALEQREAAIKKSLDDARQTKLELERVHADRPAAGGGAAEGGRDSRRARAPTPSASATR